MFIFRKLRRTKLLSSKGFTLAEVLITLGIIGVVAAMTIPTLINNYQKNQTVTQLKASYSTIYEAINLSTVENGPVTDWSFGSGTAADTLAWFNSYLAPYMKFSEASIGDRPGNTGLGTSAVVRLLNGTLVIFWQNGSERIIHVYIVLKGPLNKAIEGKTSFTYLLSGIQGDKPLRPYDGTTCTKTQVAALGRDFWLTSTCSTANHCECTHPNDGTGARAYCAGLIMNDGWQIKEDYPFFN